MGIGEDLKEKWWKEMLRSEFPERYQRLYGKRKSWDSVCEPYRQLAAELEKNKKPTKKRKASTKKNKLGNIISE